MAIGLRETFTFYLNMLLFCLHRSWLLLLECRSMCSARFLLPTLAKPHNLLILRSGSLCYIYVSTVRCSHHRGIWNTLSISYYGECQHTDMSDWNDLQTFQYRKTNPYRKTDQLRKRNTGQTFTSWQAKSVKSIFQYCSFKEHTIYLFPVEYSIMELRTYSGYYALTELHFNQCWKLSINKSDHDVIFYRSYSWPYSRMFKRKL